MARWACGAALVWVAGCGASTAVERSDGWRYAGEVVAADGSSVTLAMAKGPVVIPRAEVVRYDLPGNGMAVVGGALMAPSGLILVGALDEGDVNDAVLAGSVVALGAGLVVWGLLTWLDARAAWSADGTVAF